MDKKRIYYFDLIKCLASYLICLSHFGTLDTDIIERQDPGVYFNYFLQGLASVGVPIFLMVNGAFVLNKNYPASKIFYRAKSYVLLYLIWGALTLLILAPLFNDRYTMGSFLLAVFDRKLGRTNHLWFLMAMTYLYLLFPFFKALYDKGDKVYTRYLVTIIFVCTFGYVLINGLLHTAGFFLNSPALKRADINAFFLFNPFDQWYAYTLVYFISGGLLAKKIALFNYRSGIFFALILISMILLFGFGLLQTHIEHKEYDLVWGGHDQITTLIMAVSIFVLCARIQLQNPKVIEATRIIGTNTLGIYFIHMPLGYWLTDYYKNLAISDYLFADVLYALLLMITSLLLSMTLQKIPVVSRLVKI